MNNELTGRYTKLKGDHEELRSKIYQTSVSVLKLVDDGTKETDLKKLLIIFDMIKDEVEFLKGYSS